MAMTTNMEQYLNIVKQIWLDSDTSFPEFLEAVPRKVKEENEQYVRDILNAFQRQINCYPRILFGRRKWKRVTRGLIMDVLSNEAVIGLHFAMGYQRISTFYEELIEFLRHVRKFAPELSFEDIGQAIRNYIVYAMFKEIHQVNRGFSMAGFGYSMLYPFTDNYIDSDKITAAGKQKYNQLIRNQLEGHEVHPDSIHQKKTCELLQAIESEYPRDTDSMIYQLLLRMLQAQEDSLRQQSKDLKLTEAERLDISVYKGGISVFIDRYLAKKEIKEEDLVFYLGLGLFLQLADDLQDIGPDSGQGYQTLFTLNLNPCQEEFLVNQLLNFIHFIMSSYKAENEVFKNFVMANCYQLIFTSISRSKEFFSRDYLSRLEQYLPVTNPFFEDFKKDLVFSSNSKMKKKYFKILDCIIFE